MVKLKINNEYNDDYDYNVMIQYKKKNILTITLMTLTSVQSIFAGNESSREYWFTIHLGPMPKGCLPVNKYKYKLQFNNNFFREEIKEFFWTMS